VTLSKAVHRPPNRVNSTGARGGHTANRLHNPRGNDARSVGGADAGGRTGE
jgi:hypothetical protein